jgi:hypothetical protein
MTIALELFTKTSRNADPSLFVQRVVIATVEHESPPTFSHNIPFSPT